MKYLLYIYLIGIVLSCKTEASLDDMQIDNYIIEIDVSKYEDGFQMIYNDTHKIVVGHVKNAEKDGFWRFYKNKKLIAEGSYKNSIKDGFWKLFYRNGHVKSEGHYRSGNPYGYWKYYSKEGEAEEKRYNTK